MTEIVRYSKVGLQDLNLGENTFEVTLADGRVVTMDQISLNTLNDLSPLLVTAVNTVTPVNSLTARSLPERFADWYNVKDYGAIGDGSTDDTVAIQAAITACGAADGGTVLLPPGNYKVTATIFMPLGGVHLRGSSTMTIITFAPTANDVCLHVGLGATSAILFPRITDLRIYSADTAYNKTAIVYENARIGSIERIFINGPLTSGTTMWTGGTGLGSVGIQTKGHEMCVFKDLQIQADSPLQISADTLTPGQGADHFNFHNCAFVSRSTFACVTIDSNLQVSDTHFSGTQPWVGGKYGIYWVDTATAAISQRITFDGVRSEQSTDVTGYFAYIEHNFGIQQLTFRDCRPDITSNGFHFRKCVYVTIDGCSYPGTLVGMDATAAANGYTIDIRNSFFDNATTMTFTNYRQVFGLSKPALASLIPRTAFYAYAASPATSSFHQVQNGVYEFYLTGSLADLAQVAIEGGAASGYTHAHITCSMHGATKDEMMILLYTAGVGFKLAGTANTAVANTAGTMCVFGSGSNPNLRNRLGEVCTYMIQCRMIV